MKIYPKLSLIAGVFISSWFKHLATSSSKSVGLLYIKKIWDYDEFDKKIR